MKVAAERVEVHVVALKPMIGVNGVIVGPASGPAPPSVDVSAASSAVIHAVSFGRSVFVSDGVSRFVPGWPVPVSGNVRRRLSAGSVPTKPGQLTTLW